MCCRSLLRRVQSFKNFDVCMYFHPHFEIREIWNFNKSFPKSTKIHQSTKQPNNIFKIILSFFFRRYLGEATGNPQPPFGGADRRRNERGHRRHDNPSPDVAREGLRLGGARQTVPVACDGANRQLCELLRVG